VNAVIDTNVLVSGLLSPAGPPGEIIDLIFSRQLEPVYDDRIIHEYTIVLRRPKFHFTADEIDELLYAVQVIGLGIVPHHTALLLPDDHDRPFVECALGCSTNILITGNSKHYPPSVIKGVQLFSPREFLEKFRRSF
jgi:putative PIN family toxin of toxin-antitoxin system